MVSSVYVVGLGGVGGFVGAKLCVLGSRRDSGGPQVYFVARGAHLDAIRSSGLTYVAPSGEVTITHPTGAYERVDDLPPPDLVVLTVKSYGIASACRNLRGVLKGTSRVLPLLNGIDIYGRVRDVLPDTAVLPGCVYIASSITAPGVVKHAGGTGQIFFGPDPDHPDADAAEVRDLLVAAGIPATLESDVAPALWTKYLFIAALGMVTAARRLTVGAVLEDPGAKAELVDMMREIAALAAASGVALPADVVESAVAKAFAFPHGATTSYQRDREVPGKSNEGDLFGRTILRLGKKLSVPTPVVARVARQLDPD